jgi:ribosome maturation factor RimP
VSLKESIENILSDCGVTLYDMEMTTESERKIFRIYITCKGGVSLDKCAEVTNILSPILDLEPPVADAYTLEVSSPGIERALKNFHHYECSVGEMVKIKLINTDKIIGTLEEVNEKEIVVLEEDGQKTTIPFDEITKARTYFQW